MKYKVRYLGELDDPDDQEQILDLDQVCFPYDARPNFLETHWWIVYDEANKPVGYSGAKLWAPDNFVYISRCGVIPEARGNHLQQRTLRAIERWAKKIGADGMYTDTYRNVPSGNSFIRAGFQLFWPEELWATTESTYWYKQWRKTK